MKIKHVSMVTIFCVLLLVFCLNANAEELTATLGNLIGEVEVLRASETEAIPAEEGMTLNVGDTVITGGGSFATVTFLPKTFIQVASDSKFRIAVHEISDETSILTTKTELLSGHLSKVVLNNLPPDANFLILQDEFMPTEAEGYHSPEEIADMTAPYLVRAKEAGGEGEAAVLSNITGLVEIIRVGEVGTIQARDGMSLNVGDILLTGRDSFATITFNDAPQTFMEASGNSEFKIVRNEVDAETSKLNTRVDVLSGHPSRAIVRNLPPDTLFEVVLVDYIPLEAEPFEEPLITVYWLPTISGE